MSCNAIKAYAFVLAAALTLNLALPLPAYGQAPGGMQMPPTTVEAVKPTLTTLSDTIDGVGSLRASESITVRPELAGRIEAILFNEGQPVIKGALLFRLDATLVRAEMAEAEANSVNSTRELKRAQELAERKLIAPAEVDAKRAQAKVDEARLNFSKAKLDKAEIHAPFAGLAGLRKVSIGEYVNIGDALVDLVETNPLKVDFSVPEIYLDRIKVGQKIQIKVDVFPHQSFDGEIYAIAPQVELATRALALRATLPNAELKLKPGQFARVALEIGSKTNALLVPEQALWPQGEKQFVYVAKDGKAGLTEVNIGLRQPGLVEIISGLKPDDLVIIAGQQKIGPGAPVQVK